MPRHYQGSAGGLWQFEFAILGEDVAQPMHVYALQVLSLTIEVPPHSAELTSAPLWMPTCPSNVLPKHVRPSACMLVSAHQALKHTVHALTSAKLSHYFTDANTCCQPPCPWYCLIQANMLHW